MPRQQLVHHELTPRSVATMLGDQWTVRIVGQLSLGQQRYGTLRSSLGISTKTLAKRLKHLEQEAIITRTLYAQVPLRVEYELTEKGYELKAIIDSLAEWEKKWVA